MKILAMLAALSFSYSALAEYEVGDFVTFNWDTGFVGPCMIHEKRPGLFENTNGLLVRMKDGRLKFFAENRVWAWESNSKSQKMKEEFFSLPIKEELRSSHEYFPPDSKTHTQILQFLSKASRDPSRVGMGSYVVYDFRKHYLAYFPNIPIELLPYEDKFIGALDLLGFFQYRDGGDGGFNFAGFCSQIESYAELFSRNPQLLDKVRSDYPNVYSYRKCGQVANPWQFLQDLEEEDRYLDDVARFTILF